MGLSGQLPGSYLDRGPRPRSKLGRRIGRSHRTVGMIEAGQYPDPRVSLALALAEALETTVEDLFGTG